LGIKSIRGGRVRLMPRLPLRDRLAAGRAARADVRAGVFTAQGEKDAGVSGFVRTAIDAAGREQACRKASLHDEEGRLGAEVFQTATAVLELRDRECAHPDADRRDRLSGAEARAARAGVERARMAARFAESFGRWTACCAREAAATEEAMAAANQLLGHYEKVRNRRLARAARRQAAVPGEPGRDVPGGPGVGGRWRPSPVPCARPDPTWQDPIALLPPALDEDARKVVREALRLLAPETRSPGGALP
jgi:hypothetical protein